MKAVVHHIIAAVLVMVSQVPAKAAADNSWQERMLFNPTDAQRAVEESRQRIMIYHGMTDIEVATAMQQQFDRVEDMMFTGTVVTDKQGSPLKGENGQPVFENDGC